MPPRWPRRFVLPILAAIAISVFYAAASWNNRFVYDDHEVIENQYPIRHLNDLGRIFIEPHYLNFPYYRPITRSTFAMQMSISGPQPRAYHLFNALLAGVVMLAAFALLRRPSMAIGEVGALLAAGWFALHPAFSECVYPAASGRETLMPALFILLAVWAWLGPGRLSLWLAVFFLALALLCKEQAAVLPGIFLLADVLRLTDFARNLRGWMVRYAPIALIFAGYFFVRHLVFHQPTLRFTLGQHPLEPAKSMLYGLQTAIAPFMTLHYEPPFEGWFDARLTTGSLVALAVLLVAILGGGRALIRLFIFFAGWFVLLQLPTAHIVAQEAQYSERYAALAILAVPAVAAAAAQRSRYAPNLALAALAWMGILAWISFMRAGYYTDDASFCLQWENTSPTAPGPHDGFGRLAQQRGQTATAISEYQKALALEPTDATARNNLANLLADAGDFGGAQQQYEWLIHHRAAGEDYVATLTNYAQLLGQEAYARNDATLRDQAHGLLEEAIALRPDYAQAHVILGEWNEAFGSRDAAARQYEIALHLHPDWPEVDRKLRALHERGDAGTKGNR